MLNRLPSWWPVHKDTPDNLVTACIGAAEAAFPNEACGMILCSSVAEIALDHVHSSNGNRNFYLHLFDAVATPYSVSVPPEEVVRFAYDLVQSQLQVAATFHSHPGGQGHWSAVDEMLRMWATDHVVAVKQDGVWKLLFAPPSDSSTALS